MVVTSLNIPATDIGTMPVRWIMLLCGDFVSDPEHNKNERRTKTQQESCKTLLLQEP
jgi:hypothetical protein